MSLEQIEAALTHAKAKHPDPWSGRLHALCVLLEEVAEVVWALARGDRANLREELAQVAAVCWRWLEWEAGRRNA
jgi:NTP pyrophosphatase (non-canonical NTP hydrolase)